MAAKKSQPSMPKGKAANTLYVVLHGLISLIDIGADGFIAYVVDIGAEHKYLYGNWLTESDIPKKEEGGPPLYATLLGVEKGHSDIDCKKNAVLKVSRLPDEK